MRRGGAWRHRQQRTLCLTVCMTGSKLYESFAKDRGKAFERCSARARRQEGKEIEERSAMDPNAAVARRPDRH